jgi:glycosyltransferase involved in cell wall biosynthesis
MNIKRLSVIITTYNREDLIGDTIQSILSSTFKDFELIVCDDASSDQTVQIVQSFSEKDSRIKLFINEKNLGDYPNRNKAASFASGIYLKYVDSDDLIYPWTLEQMVTWMDQHPEAGWGVSCEDSDKIKPYPFIAHSDQSFKLYYDHGRLFLYSPLNVIIRRTVFEKLGGFPEKRMIGDFEMWHKLALESPVLLLPGGMVWRREHADQEYQSQRKYAISYEKIRIEYLKKAESILSPAYVQTIHRKRMKTILFIMLRSLLKANFSEFLFRIRLINTYLNR